MKKINTMALWLSPTLIFFLLVACILSISSCDDPPEVCTKCNEDFSTQKKLKQITHHNAIEGGLLETYKYFYKEDLLDSIYHAKYLAGPDSIVTKLNITYPDGVCLPSSYSFKKYYSATTISAEKGLMTLAGDHITNKHIATYEDAENLGVTKNAEIDYLYNSSGQVTSRNGTDFGLISMLPNPYGNLSDYTYTAGNITSLNTLIEQSGYTLDITFDTNKNPFNIQGGALYYLFLTSYPDLEHFETICLDENNPTQMIYHGTAVITEHVTITYVFTYTYDADHYPVTATIEKTFYDGMTTTTVTNLGIYNFTYY